jgi:hypothetical protein
MQASEIKLQQIIEGTKQYVVPLFQRPYSFANIILQIWSYFGDESVQLSQSSSLTGTTPKQIRLFGQEHSVKSWRDVLETTLNVLSDLEPDKFKDIMQQFPHFIGWDEKDFRST